MFRTFFARLMVVICVLAWLSALAAPSLVRGQAPPASGPPASGTARGFDPDRRVPWDTAHLLGTPDPPPPYRVQRVFPNLRVNLPVHVVRQPGSDRLWFIQQPRSDGPTTICRMRDVAEVGEYETVLSIDSFAYDVIFHPKFLENGFVYVGDNGPHGSSDPSMPKQPKRTRVTRYTVELREPYRVDPKSAREIISWPSDGHNGGALAFGLDGMLYVTSGDGTSDSDTHLTGQGLDHLLAKVLRIDVDHPEQDRPYRVPPDNPFVSRADTRPETWAYGLRNPWRMTVDVQTGHLWVGNNGQDLWEQIYFVRKGDNYGWSVMEGSHPFYPTRKAGPTPFVKPAAEHHHSEARSLTGGIVYYGQRYPELRGAYLYGDYSTGKIWGMRHDGQKVVWHRELADTTLAITGFGADTQGEILICDYRGQNEGAFYTLEPRPADVPAPPFPRTLSATGLFQSVAGHVPHPALVPYSVNSPLWSDGAHKERLFVLPGADSTIELTPTRGWKFPNGSVLVKSFALEDEPGDPQTRRWIETRLLIRSDNEWVGYSYQWNDEQTDAVLVEAGGKDAEFAIHVPRSREHPDGQRKQAWRYPSRAECMVCHSRAANYVLGLSTAQMNRTHDYGGRREHQLQVLERLGMLKGEVDVESMPRLVDPYDPRQDLELRARSYLHANCAHCHVEAGGGNAQMLLEHPTAVDKMKILDVQPLHHTFEIADARLIAPGAPPRSILWQRVSRRGTGQMPPLATAQADDRAVEMLREWITSLKK